MQAHRHLPALGSLIVARLVLGYVTPREILESCAGNGGSVLGTRNPRPAGQFLELQPAFESGTFSPDWNSGFSVPPETRATSRLSVSISRRSQPTMLSCTPPSGEIKKIVGTFVSPYAFETG